MTVLLVGGVAWGRTRPRSAQRSALLQAPHRSGRLSRLEMAVHLSRPRHRERQLSGGAGWHAGQLRAHVLGSDEQLFVPQLGGQIYTMAGMTTRLQLQADHPGKYPDCRPSSAATVLPCALPLRQCRQASSSNGWRQLTTGPVLDAQAYADMVKPSEAVAPFTYRAVASGLFNTILSSGSPDDPMCINPFIEDKTMNSLASSTGMQSRSISPSSWVFRQR